MSTKKKTKKEKTIDTNNLIGKAFVHHNRLSDVEDIVLSPDDYLSEDTIIYRVGLCLINTDTGNEEFRALDPQQFVEKLNNEFIPESEFNDAINKFKAGPSSEVISLFNNYQCGELTATQLVEELRKLLYVGGNKNK